MTYKDYLEAANKLLQDNPGVADYWVVHSTDDDGSAFYPVICSPSTGRYDPETNKWKAYSGNSNSVCIN